MERSTGSGGRRSFKRIAVAVAAILLCLVALIGGWQSFGRDLAFYAGPAEDRLSQTGLYANIARRAMAPAVRPFAPQFELWSDGATKRRFIFLPEGSRIDTRNPDRWNFPAGTRLWKEFARDGVVVETRMLLKTGPEPGDWDMAVYLWRADGSDADKLAFARPDANGTAHDVPGPRMCVQCHGAGAQSRPLGFSAVQLPWSHATLTSITSLGAAGRLSDPPAQPLRIPGPAEARAALGYLHSNCGSCHYEGSGAVPARVPLRLALRAGALGSLRDTYAAMHAIDRPPVVAGLGTQVYVSPGNPAASLMWRRMGVRHDPWQMPPIATEEVDRRGSAIVGRWINGLGRSAPAD
jgi:hypothetical protein